MLFKPFVISHLKSRILFFFKWTIAPIVVDEKCNEESKNEEKLFFKVVRKSFAIAKKHSKKQDCCCCEIKELSKKITNLTDANSKLIEKDSNRVMGHLTCYSNTVGANLNIFIGKSSLIETNKEECEETHEKSVTDLDEAVDRNLTTLWT